MKKILKKMISIMLIVILLGSFEAPSIFQTVIAVSEYATSNGNYEEEDIFKTVFTQGEIENIIPFIFKNYNDRVSKEYIINQFEKAGKIITNESEIQNPIGTGTQIKTTNETYTVLVYGDVDGDGEVSAFDAQEVLRHDVRMDNHVLTGIYEIAGNVYNDDDVTDAFDAQRILRFSVGYESVPIILYILPTYPTPTPTPEPTTPPIPPRPQVRVNVTAELETKDQYYYVDEHKIVLNATRKDNNEKYTITSASATIKKDGNTVPTSEASITKKEKQDDGSYVLTFVAKKVGTYTITAKVNSDEAKPIEITIVENPVISSVIFGTETKPISSATVIIGEKREIPIIFKNEQGLTPEIDISKIKLSPDNVEGLEMDIDENKLTITGTEKIDATKIKVLYNDVEVGSITLSTVAEITTISSTIDKGSFDKYYEDEKYEVSIIYKEGEGPAENVEWKIYKNGSSKEATDATITLNPDTQKYEFKTNQNATGEYKILAVIPQNGEQPKVIELETKDSITVEKNTIINKMTITKKDNTTVVVTPEETTGTLDIYNGYTQSLPVKFEHVYSNGKTSIINALGNDIKEPEYDNTKLAIEKRQSNEYESSDTEFAKIYFSGKVEGEVSVTLKTSKNQTIGTIPVTVRNPQIQIKPVEGTTELIEVGTNPDTYFEVLKVDKDGNKLGLLDVNETLPKNNQLTVTIKDEDNDSLGVASVLYKGYDGIGTEPKTEGQGEITHIGIGIDSENYDEEAVFDKIISNLRDGKGTLTISYNGLKTAEGNDNYTYGLKFQKPITTVTLIVDKGSFDQYYEDEKYEILPVYGEGEGPAKNIEWKIYKNGSSKEATDATITLNPETEKYEFKTNQNGTGTYKIQAIIPNDGEQELKEAEITITVVKNNIINKMTITKKDNTTIVVTPKETTGTLDIYNGYAQSLPVKFEHVYSNGKTSIINALGNDIKEPEYDNTKLAIEKRQSNEYESSDTEFAKIYFSGKVEGEVSVTLKTSKNQTIGTIPVTVRNPQIQIKLVKDGTPVEGTPELIEVGTKPDTYFEVLKVDKDGNKLGLLDVNETLPKNNQLTVTVKDEDNDALGVASVLYKGYDGIGTDSKTEGQGEITHIGIGIDSENYDEEDVFEKIIINLTNGDGTLEISYNGLKTVEGNDKYTYKLKLNT